MNVQRICFLGTRTGNFEATAALFRDVLGLHNAHAEPGWSVFQLPSRKRDYVEVFGPEKQDASLFPTEISDGIFRGPDGNIYVMQQDRRPAAT